MNLIFDSMFNEISYIKYLIFFVVFLCMGSFPTFFGLPNFGEYFSLLTIIIFFLYSKVKLLDFSLMLLAFCYIIFLPTSDRGMNVIYMVNYISCIIALFTLPSISIAGLDRYNNKFVIVFSLVFLICYAITIVPTEETYDDRVYLHGFIIAHAFSYFTAFLGYFLIKQEKLLIASIILLAGAVVGTRSGLLINMIPIVSYGYTKLVKDKLSLGTYFFSAIITVLFIVFISATSLGAMIASVYDTFENASFDIFNSNSADSEHFTAGRNVLWGLAINEIASDGFSINNIFGRGPGASYDLTERFYGERLWLHNDLFDILYCLGFFGLFLYLSALFYFFKRSNYSWDIILISVIALFTNGLFTYKPIVFFALIILNQQINEFKNDEKCLEEQHE
ncbi:MAG: hypothetical protein ACRCZQ_04710 [Bacteroidales bacterium]